MLKLQQPAQVAQQATQLSAEQAEQAATQLTQAVSQFQQRLAITVAEAGPPAGDDAAGVRALEVQLLPRFPEASDLRLLPLSELSASNYALQTLALRNHIEIDLLRKAGTRKAPAMESYQHENQWLTSVAQQVVLPGQPETPAIALLTFPNQVLQQYIPATDSLGLYELQQQFTDNRGRDHLRNIAASGTAVGDTAPLAGTAPVSGTPWQIRFTPGPGLLAGITPERWPYLLVAALALAGGLLGALAPSRLPRRAPSLRPRGRASFTGKAAAAEPDDVPTPAAPPAELERSLLYQNHDIVEEHAEQALDLDLDLGLDLDLEEGDGGFPAHIFRAYDIRGRADTELTDELVRRIAIALAAELHERGESQLVLASDGRLSSPRIRSQLISALLESGLSIADIGIVPTPLVYFATHELDIPSAIMVTGSHNPATDNGMKIVLGGKTIGAGGIARLREQVQANHGPQPGFRHGKLTNHDLSEQYVERILSDVAIPAPLKLVIDASNGATGELGPLLFRELHCEVTPLNCTIDGNFPGHPPDTSNEDNLRQLAEKVVEVGADLGVAFDGDGDRVVVVTGSGRIVRADETLMLLAGDVVARNPGADVVFDVKCSRHLARVVTELGGRPVMWKTGHAFMKEKMLETGALLGGEFSGHIFFGERWYGHDDGLYAAARIAELCATQDTSLDELLASVPVSVSTPDIRIPVAESDKFALVERLVEEADFGPGKLTTLDGLRVDFNAGWGLLRASNTEAALTARFEGDTPEQLDNVKAVFREQLARIAPELGNAF
ncbi:phosphomannomutase/phosphoglucomutase [Parahaliea maris]|uniref:phosphomannomutase/phosphoglucomutase n=1 Tax=Parahaliea maris TaxID=2716870 RepID=UPI0016504112|nr:phosphomannomutase/phosphoglucomutase [Parahaliea maris]